ncbi:tripartite tricarboxylate transporter substrate binding protein [Hydrogenophaga sp. 2FB]|uniref:Bug family tripartite tricarboxylate transporter substrate binding protein n=1 Tax=Hydrogenophaga sp. 2FB TaxID=2502187 RepID=UPI0010F85BC1|nr:tripartite tricarboxylate transporter substrate binding protein [Hydrogenophaga sp. 2FB]
MPFDNDIRLNAAARAPRRTVLAVGLALTVAALPAAWAQTPWPAKPVRIVVPFNAGGPVDQLARVMALKLAPILGQPVVVENKGGAATIIGWDTVAKSAPDGYTLLMAGVGGRAILPSLANLPYDPAKDFASVTRVANSPNVFVVQSGRGPQNLKDWLVQAKASPGKLNVGLAAPGTLTHFAGVVLQKETGITLTEVPYKGGAPAVNALLSGEIDVLTADIGAVLPFVQSGRLTALAVADRSRSPFLPQVPTLTELGVADIDGVNVFGLYAPARTPRDVLTRIARASADVLQQQEVKDIFAKLGMTAEASTPEQFEAINRAQTERWAPIARASGVRIN